MQDLRGKIILVTGADGFIGSHLCEQLLTAGAQVRALVQYNASNHWGWLDTLSSDQLSNIKVFLGDVRDRDSLRSAVQGCQWIFHLAALIAIPYSYHAPESYIDVNLKGTLNILQLAHEYHCEKVIHTSTSEVYGSAQSIPIAETHALNAQSPYAASKIGADQMALAFVRSFALPVAIVRPFNTYGPRQSARAIIPTVITQILSGNKIIKLGALTPTRDFNYIQDTINGFLAVALSDLCIGTVINIGSGFEISIQDLVHLIAKLCDTSIEVVTDQQRLRPDTSEVKRLCADIQKADQLAHWKPAATGLNGLQQGLQRTIEWFSIPQNRHRYKEDLYHI